MAPAAIGRDEYISFEEAAELLGLKRQSVHALVMRKRLHSFPDPDDGRRRRLLRSEVEARLTSSERADSQRNETGAREQGLSDKERDALIALGASMVGIMAIVTLARSNDPTVKAVAIGALAGLALLVILEQFKSGKIDELQRARLERLVATVQEQQDRIDELERILKDGQRLAEDVLKAS